MTYNNQIPFSLNTGSCIGDNNLFPFPQIVSIYLNPILLEEVKTYYTRTSILIPMAVYLFVPCSYIAVNLLITPRIKQDNGKQYVFVN